MRLAMALAVSAALLIAQPAAEQAFFKDFLSWYKTYDGSPYPDEIRKAYAKTLAGRGLAAPEVERQIAAVDRIAATQPHEFIGLNFDKLYSRPDAPFTHDASQYLARAIADLKPGKALDVAMGQGRNALFLASKGWDVTGYDLSEGGLQQARAAAANAGLKINAVRDSHESFDSPAFFICTEQSGSPKTSREISPLMLGSCPTSKISPGVGENRFSSAIKPFALPPGTS